MKVLVLYIILLFISMPWHGEMCTYENVKHSVQIPAENDTNFPEHEKENEDVENYPSECYIYPDDEIGNNCIPTANSKVFRSLTENHKNGWSASVFAPPEFIC